MILCEQSSHGNVKRVKGYCSFELGPTSFSFHFFFRQIKRELSNKKNGDCLISRFTKRWSFMRLG